MDVFATAPPVAPAQHACRCGSKTSEGWRRHVGPIHTYGKQLTAQLRGSAPFTNHTLRGEHAVQHIQLTS